MNKPLTTPSESANSATPRPDVAEALAAMAAETAALRQSTAGTVADTLAGWLATRYVMTIRRLAKEAGDEGIDLRTLAALTADVVALRKGDHSAERLCIERERLEIERDRCQKHMEAHFEEWLKLPDIADRICGPGLTPKEKEARIRELFGLPERGKGGLSREAIAEMEAALKILS